MKKIVTLLLSICLILSLCSGCFLLNEKKVEANTDSILGQIAPNTEPVEDAPEEEKEENSTGYVRGTNSAEGWKSEYLGLQFIPTSDMVMSTDEEMDAIMQFSAEAMVDNGYGEKIVDYAMLNTVYEMMATDINGNNVSVLVEKVILSRITTEQYVEALKINLQDQTDLNYTIVDSYDVTLWGIDFCALDATANLSGAKLNQRFLVAKFDERMLTIAITATTGDSIDRILGCFVAYNNIRV